MARARLLSRALYFGRTHAPAGALVNAVLRPGTQEFYGDVLLGTHHVRDLQDQMNDRSAA